MYVQEKYHSTKCLSGLSDDQMQIISESSHPNPEPGPTTTNKTSPATSPIVEVRAIQDASLDTSSDSDAREKQRSVVIKITGVRDDGEVGCRQSAEY